MHYVLVQEDVTKNKMTLQIGKFYDPFYNEIILME